ncbi:LORF2 protein, partial [Crocuta crocuta]
SGKGVTAKNYKMLMQFNNKNPKQPDNKRLAQTLLQRRHAGGQRAREKVPHILALRETQIRTTARDDLHPPEWLPSKRQEVTGEGADEGDPRALPGGAQTGVASWRTGWRLLKKSKTGPPHDPATPLLGTRPKGLKAGCRGEIGAPAFTA